MFNGASDFNQDISNWSVDNVTDMSNMFSSARSFNQNIGGWNTSQVEDMRQMFENAYYFNQDLSLWDVGNVLDMREMFDNAIRFDQSLGAWDISNVNTMLRMLNGSAISSSNYDATLIGWSTLDPEETQIPENIELGANGLFYCSSESARDALIADVTSGGYNWTITGDALDCSGSARVAAEEPLDEVVEKEEQLVSRKLTLYPNPANELLTISGDQLVEGTVYIHDLNGKEVYSIIDSEQSRLDIDTSKIPSGVYLVQIISSQGTVAMKKLVVEH